MNAGHSVLAAQCLLVVLCSCGACGAESPRESDGEVVGDDAAVDSSAPDVDSSAPDDVDSSAPDDVDSSAPYDFGPQRDVASEALYDPPGVRVKIAHERWLHGFSLQDGEAGRLFPSLARVGFAADDKRFYAVTGGIPAHPQGFRRHLLHALDLEDGHEAWRVELTVAVYVAGTLVDDDGNILVVANQDGFQGGGYAYKVSSDGTFMWQISPPTDPHDPVAAYGSRTAPAIDWDNNYYFVRGVTVSSTDSDGQARWTQLLAPEVRFGCSEGTIGSLFVLDDSLWFIGSCGVFSFSLEGDVRVWKPLLPDAALYNTAIPLPDGTLVAAGGIRADFLDQSAQILGTVTNLKYFEQSSLLAASNDSFVAAYASSYGFDRTRRRWYQGMDTTLNAMIDEHGHLIAQTHEDRVNILDAVDGTWIAVYDVGRRVTGELGVVPRAGRLIVPLNLGRNEYRAAAVSCVEIPELGLPAPGVWSRSDGNQKNQRRYRTQPHLPIEPPVRKGDR